MAAYFVLKLLHVCVLHLSRAQLLSSCLLLLLLLLLMLLLLTRRITVERERERERDVGVTVQLFSRRTGERERGRCFSCCVRSLRCCLFGLPTRRKATIYM